uniref:Uncharacterized protein n=1 Tax=Parascaris univalens TaxID=6257 RepID=A0A915B0C6_PARUN
EEIDEKELEKARNFFRKKEKLEELKADPSLQQPSATNMETLKGEYMECLEELAKANEELNREQQLFMELKEQLETIRSGGPER